MSTAAIEILQMRQQGVDIRGLSSDSRALRAGEAGFPAAPGDEPMAAAGDVVLIAGKGHEDNQESAGQRIAFSDAAVAAEVLAAWT